MSNLPLGSLFTASALAQSLQITPLGLLLPPALPTSFSPPQPGRSVCKPDGHSPSHPSSGPFPCIQGEMPSAEPATQVPTSTSTLPSRPPRSHSPRLTPSLPVRRSCSLPPCLLTPVCPLPPPPPRETSSPTASLSWNSVAFKCFFVQHLSSHRILSAMGTGTYVCLVSLSFQPKFGGWDPGTKLDGGQNSPRVTGPLGARRKKGHLLLKGVAPA